MIDGSTDTDVLNVDNLGKEVSSPEGALTILEGVSFHVDAGETVAVLGPSGAGKSTLLALMAGLDTPSSGSVHLLGQDIGTLSEDGRAVLRAGNVGFVFQSFHLLPSLTAVENVMLPLELAGEQNAGASARAVLNDVGLGARLRHYPRQLSGGEQQRVAIARALAAGAKIILADEPTGNLDQETGQTIMDLLFDLQASSGTTLVLVTHDPKLAARCSRVIEIRDGLIHSDKTN